jgi:hypothetical protein
VSSAGKVHHATKWGRSPAKGTLLRRMLKMLMRPEGATTFEMLEAGIPSGGGSYMGVLRDQKGWDIRAFPCPEERREPVKGARGRRPPVVYKVVGRMRWDGGYRTLVDPKTYVP